MRLERKSGVLLHPSSLASAGEIGDLGPAAYAFVDFLAAARQRLWQILPLGPLGAGNSPYDGRSSFAGNPLLISIDRMRAERLLPPDFNSESHSANPTVIDYDAARQAKVAALSEAFARFDDDASAELRARFNAFMARNAAWLPDFALFQALRLAHGERSWRDWEPGLVHREPNVLDAWRQRLAGEVRYHTFVQFVFEHQWGALKRYANERGIEIIGDIPIYVALDSADVWANQELFLLDASGQPTVVAGVPPDYFSATGQLWGNPCYRWDLMVNDGYRWWVDRFRRVLALCDIVRVDHFRAFAAGWQVPTGEETAVHGRWVGGPGIHLFHRVQMELGSLPIIVEDLGIITEDVERLRHELGYPGMKVLQFAFGGDSDNPYLPHNYERRCAVYTGTHDNDTTRGWYDQLSREERQHVRRYLGTDCLSVPWDFIRLALASTAEYALIPMQDVLGLGSEARMNRPGTSSGNWVWRMAPGDLGDAPAQLADLTVTYGRAGETSG